MVCAVKAGCRAVASWGCSTEHQRRQYDRYTSARIVARSFDKAISRAAHILPIAGRLRSGPWDSLAHIEFVATLRDSGLIVLMTLVCGRTRAPLTSWPLGTLGPYRPYAPVWERTGASLNSRPLRGSALGPQCTHRARPRSHRGLIELVAPAWERIGASRNSWPTRGQWTMGLLCIAPLLGSGGHWNS